MLFRKKMQKACEYCVHSTEFGCDQMLCTKHGVVSKSYQCRKFTYDPLKRIPLRPRALDLSRYDGEDYSL